MTCWNTRDKREHSFPSVCLSVCLFLSVCLSAVSFITKPLVFGQCGHCEKRPPPSFRTHLTSQMGASIKAGLAPSVGDPICWCVCAAWTMLTYSFSKTSWNLNRRWKADPSDDQEYHEISFILLDLRVITIYEKAYWQGCRILLFSLRFSEFNLRNKKSEKQQICQRIRKASWFRTDV